LRYNLNIFLKGLRTVMRRILSNVVNVPTGTGYLANTAQSGYHF